MNGSMKQWMRAVPSVLAAAAGCWLAQRRRRYPLERVYGPASWMVLPSWIISGPVAKMGNRFLRWLPLAKPPAGVSRTQQWIPAANGKAMALTIYDGNGGESAPCLVYFHGGAFLFEAAPYLHRNLAELAGLAKCKVVMVQYRTAERCAFPGPFFDARAAVWYVWQHSTALGIDPTRLALGGDSAGAALAAAVALWARDETELLPCLQMLLYPVLDARMATASMRRYSDAPVWNARLNRRMWRFYLRAGVPLSRSFSSPAEAGDHSCLPQAYVEVAAYDCLRDEGIAYAERLQESGVMVQLEQPPGTFHAFDAFRRAPMRQKMLLKRAQALREAFGWEEQ